MAGSLSAFGLSAYFPKDFSVAAANRRRNGLLFIVWKSNKKKSWRSQPFDE
jgi:hypothetical protein